jgi:drug/metabolite transporter (DMT)-like permease
MNRTALVTAAFGLGSAALWGAGDFSGGLAARKANVYAVALMAQAAGVVLLVALAVARAEPLPPSSDLGWGAAAGVMGAVGIAALYRALALGRMSIAAPVTAVVTAALPVLLSSISQGFPYPTQTVGFGLAVAGVWLISRSGGASRPPGGTGLALLAGVGFGGFLVFIAQVRPPALFWPLAAAKVSSFFSVLAAARLVGKPRLPATSLLPLAALAGLLDAGGNALFVLAGQRGRLDVASILASLYPAATVLLARFVLGERVSRTQAIGIAAALVAVPLIAA